MFKMWYDPSSITSILHQNQIPKTEHCFLHTLIINNITGKGAKGYGVCHSQSRIFYGVDLYPFLAEQRGKLDSFAQASINFHWHSSRPRHNCADWQGLTWEAPTLVLTNRKHQDYLSKFYHPQFVSKNRFI